MSDVPKLGALVEAFVNAVSHTRGRALALFARAQITVGQAILLDNALRSADSTPSSLAAALKLTLPSVSQMIDRLVRLGYLSRTEQAADRRKKTIAVTPKGKRFLQQLQAVRSTEYELGIAPLREPTRRELAAALQRALDELRVAPVARRVAKR